ncbi:MAG TPA: response regulator [Blastocatellia bacterium]|nr:response regulator [Blastocatellia bacterium]
MPASVLIIEDNPTNLELMEYLLDAFGFTALATADGESGLAAVRANHPDLVLCDIQLPGIDGYQVVKELKSDPATLPIPVVAVTAMAMVGDRDRIVAAGFDGYLTKPINPETFVSEIKMFLPVVAPKTMPIQSSEVVDKPAPKGPRILVVDNTPVNLKLADCILGPFGYDLTLASSVQEGLKLAQQDPPDLILSDLHMPGEDGYDFIRLVKADPRLAPIPFIFLSSTVWTDIDMRKAVALGADRFLMRPIDPVALMTEIERCIGISRRDRPDK